jgi:hypothetical protein
MRSSSSFSLTIVALLALTLGAFAAPLGFSNTPLTVPDGSSEPAIAIDNNGNMALTGLSWLTFGTNFWTGSFGSAPAFQGQIDMTLQQPGKRVLGGGDADIDIGSTGTIHASTLIFIINANTFRTGRGFQLGVSAISCPNGATSFNLSNCTQQIIDLAGDDRQWITSRGKQVWISYHDSKNSSLIRVQRSDDDGVTWKRVGDPVVGQGGATAGATFNNIQGKIVADPSSNNLYAVYAEGVPGILKAKTTTFNHVMVSRSTDGGKSWTANLVFHDPRLVDLGQVFPALAVDPITSKLYAVWSDAHNTFFASSSDHGSTWSAPEMVNVAPANTAIFPNVAAYNGTVDVVYYGTTASSDNDSSAVWNAYLSQTTDDGASFTQSAVSNTSNHVGVICTNGTGCAPGTRNLLDLFEVAIDPQNGRAGVIYTDDTLTKDAAGHPLPQVVLAQQN